MYQLQTYSQAPAHGATRGTAPSPACRRLHPLPTHPPHLQLLVVVDRDAGAAERVAKQVEPRDGGVEDVEGEEDEHPAGRRGCNAFIQHTDQGMAKQERKMSILRGSTGAQRIAGRVGGRRPRRHMVPHGTEVEETAALQAEAVHSLCAWWQQRRRNRPQPAGARHAEPQRPLTSP